MQSLMLELIFIRTVMTISHAHFLGYCLALFEREDTYIYIYIDETAFDLLGLMHSEEGQAKLGSQSLS